MAGFLQQDFMLSSPLARELFESSAQTQPIFDFHNHLSAREIYEDPCYENIGQVWLAGDHYKWRAMRTLGVEERLITGKASWKEKFQTWAQCVPQLIGNPLYVWTHMELQRYFGISEPLDETSADRIYQRCNEMLQNREYSVRNLLRKMQVETLYTTDDPADDLRYHTLLQNSELELRVCPAFRPDQALAIEKPGFVEYLKRLGDRAEVKIQTIDDLKEALLRRLEAFTRVGCRATDHGLDENIYQAGTWQEAETVFQKALRHQTLSNDEKRMYKGYLLTQLGKAYAEKGLVMQLHVGAIRNTNSSAFQRLGPDTGYDSIDDIHYIRQLAALLDQLEQGGKLPKTILYCMASKDFEMLATMAGNFQEAGIRGKVQLGAAWWFLDQTTGIRKQLDTIRQMGALSVFVGMLTDSRSFLSFPRHEYFRRILCNQIAALVENGEYPADLPKLHRFVEGICFHNAKAFFEA